MVRHRRNRRLTTDRSSITAEPLAGNPHELRLSILDHRLDQRGRARQFLTTLRNEVARHFEKKNDKGPIVDLGPRQKKLAIIASRLYDLKDCISSIIIKKLIKVSYFSYKIFVKNKNVLYVRLKNKLVSKN